MQQALSLRETIGALQDKRYLPIFLFGFCSGFPWVLHGSVLTIWLQEAGLTRTMIGAVGIIGTMYAVNWIWAPLVDQFRLPLLYKHFGQRRSWILLCQAGIALLLIAISFGDPGTNLAYIGLIALGIATLSATQDIAIDAYRINIFRRDEFDQKMPYAAAMSTIGWYAGFGFIGGALALYLGGETVGMDWSGVYRVLVLFYVVLLLLVTLAPEPELVESETTSAANTELSKPKTTPTTNPILTTETLTSSLVKFFHQRIATPFIEFFQRCGFQLAISVLLLLLLFRLGEAMLGRMSLPFYIELGFTVEQISVYQKLFGGLLTAVFSVAGAMINTRFGVIRGLFVAGIAMSGANLLFALLATVGPNTNLLMLALVVDNFFQAFATVAIVSFISYFTSRTFTGTQYALMASVSNFGRTTLASGSGAVIDFLNGNWALFFVLTTLMVIPGLCLLLWVGKLMKSHSTAHEST
ncbi:MAG: AmpG family muropeptide MFS transporter [Pseudohongiellaceae bacterium]